MGSGETGPERPSRDEPGGEWSHLDAAGRARMVDIGSKAPTRRRALAAARVTLQPGTLAAIRGGELPKGDVLSVARIAGIQAAKRTAELIPLCHPLPIDNVAVNFDFQGDRVLEIRAEVAVTARTGAEMEALTAASIAALTVYDMCKAVDPAAVLGEIFLVEKEGGKKGLYRHPGLPGRD